MYKKIKVRNHEIWYHVVEFNGEHYLSGYIDYVGKEVRESGNKFTRDNLGIRYNSPSIVPKHVEKRIETLYKKVKSLF